MFATVRMASSRLPVAALTLKQVIQIYRQNVLGLYRNMMRTIRQVPDEGDRKDLRYWASDEFKINKNATNQVRYGKANANMHHDELQSSLALANIKK
uniref:Complex 1 LYR protein domain-containing protein n=1 Tax=Oncorhynchus mykiss TaxID=8022 RepID=A0A8C7T192_ONCMY